MHGLGNDFVVIDAISQRVSLTIEQIRLIADRHFGIGCDQLLLVENSEMDGIDFKYRIFNADGGEVEQCGNGARCFARFVKEKGLIDSNSMVVETAGGVITLQIGAQQMVSVSMGIPRFNPAVLPFESAISDSVSENRYTLTLNSRSLKDRIVKESVLANSLLEADVETFKIEFSAVSMGNPHITLKITDLDSYPVKDIGKILESHPSFPKHVNVGFMHILDRSHIRLRVYERGSGETLACGTGACAAVANGITRNWLDESVEVILPGGSLQIEWQQGEHDLIMNGPASFVFEGQMTL